MQQTKRMEGGSRNAAQPKQSEGSIHERFRGAEFFVDAVECPVGHNVREPDRTLDCVRDERRVLRTPFRYVKRKLWKFRRGNFTF